MLNDEFDLTKGHNDTVQTSGDLLLSIMQGKQRNLKNKKGNNVDVVDPSLRSTLDPLTRILAKKQTRAAREMLAKPSAEVKKQMGGAAEKLSAAYLALGPQLQDALGARLFGEQGLMAKTGAGENDQKAVQRAALGDILKRISAAGTKGGGEASASDRSTLMALMGDIGALFTDTGATTGTVREEGAGDKLREALAKLIGGGKSARQLQRNFARVKEIGGSEAVAPNKNAERVNPSVDLERPPERSGIHDSGAEADAASATDKSNRLGSSKWAVAHISTDRVANTAEPFAGHMSGSPSEILQVWDMLLGVPPDEQFTFMEDLRKEDERGNRKLVGSIALNKDLQKIDEDSKERKQNTGEYFAKRVEECENEARQHDETAKQFDGKNDARAKFYRDLARDYRRMAQGNRERVEKYKKGAELSEGEALKEQKKAASDLKELTERRVSFETDPKRKERLARAAAAAAFLIGQGYHSAMEVAEGVLRYDGQNLRAVLQGDSDTHKNQDAGDMLYAGAATDLMMDLMQGQMEG